MPTSLLDDLRRLTPSIRTLAPRIEQDGTVPEPLLDQLRTLGVFRLTAPADCGGLEADPGTLVRVFEELGYADGSTGWCAMIGGATGMALGHLPPATARSMLDDPAFLIAGVAAPAGRATAAEGGFRVTGRWAFGSACRHATWLVGGAIADGRPRLFVMEAGQLTIHDTWHVAGLRGTGSHDFSADDVFVPAERAFSLAEPPTQPGPLYTFPPLSLLALGIGAVALGIARAAIEEFGELARTKPAGRSSVRVSVAEATALHASGLAYLLSEAGGVPPSSTTLRLAISTAARNAARAVDLLYHAAGGTAVYESSPLQRHFRDVHTATQHAMVSAEVTELIGADLLGEEVKKFRL
ncbi:acyl-CoA dehydrogenase family protein [Actinoplanes sp. NPDC051494]|uniref:acyl-CoA dehydrogenase family protein n=1 Tax=Actinoplanes sp. NPDC051494 TaxID=3363907 RepID=UPI003799F003